MFFCITALLTAAAQADEPPAPTEVHRLFPDCAHPVDAVDPAICYGQPSRDAYRAVALTYIALLRGMLPADRRRLQIDQANWIGRMNRECTGPAYERSEKLPSLAELSLVLQAECVKREADSRVASLKQIWGPRSTARLAGDEATKEPPKGLEEKPDSALPMTPAGEPPKSELSDLLGDLLKSQNAGTAAEGQEKDGGLQALLAPLLPKVPGLSGQAAATSGADAAKGKDPDRPADPDFDNRTAVIKALQETESRLAAGREWARGQQGKGFELLGPAESALSQCRRARQELALVAPSRYGAAAGREVWYRCLAANESWQRALRATAAEHP
ncbi:hypothetical protein [Radicibacter daui]|uniref:hypothetical protein n=1 Tax=Radicibacter daui TaxID=3064829 RepID=UPI004046A2F3